MILDLFVVLVSKEEDLSGIGLLPFTVVVFIAIMVVLMNLLMKRTPPLLDIEPYDRYKPLDYRIVLLFIANVLVSLTMAFVAGMIILLLFSN